jgi:hypothetical protein
MALALAKEKLHYGADQLDALSKQIRAGDLTPVLEIYEEDIKSPLKSAVAGTLLRSVFIQVQKAKVRSHTPNTACEQRLTRGSGGHRSSTGGYRQIAQVAGADIRVRGRRARASDCVRRRGLPGAALDGRQRPRAVWWAEEEDQRVGGVEVRSLPVAYHLNLIWNIACFIRETGESSGC